jgi:hypothetical protein
VNLRRALATILYTARLILSLPGIATCFYIKRRRAVDLFKKELISKGLSRQEAEEIARAYPFKMGDMLGILRS